VGIAHIYMVVFPSLVIILSVWPRRICTRCSSVGVVVLAQLPVQHVRIRGVLLCLLAHSLLYPPPPHTHTHPFVRFIHLSSAFAYPFVLASKNSAAGDDPHRRDYCRDDAVGSVSDGFLGCGRGMRDGLRTSSSGANIATSSSSSSNGQRSWKEQGVRHSKIDNGSVVSSRPSRYKNRSSVSNGPIKAVRKPNLRYDEGSAGVGNTRGGGGGGGKKAEERQTTTTKRQKKKGR
jgi:hypothetical protein